MKKTELDFIIAAKEQIGTYQHGRKLVRAVGEPQLLNKSKHPIYFARGIDRQGNHYHIFWEKAVFEDADKFNRQPYSIIQQH